jgi:hypothetical protein
MHQSTWYEAHETTTLSPVPFLWMTAAIFDKRDSWGYG